MTENMKKCLELINKDDEARNRLMGSEERTKEQFMELVIAYGAKNGITLTEEDFSGDRELTDDELDAVAGGEGIEVIEGIEDIERIVIGSATFVTTFTLPCHKCLTMLDIMVYDSEFHQIPSYKFRRKCPKCGN